jgi:hypothetical protein
MEDRHRTKAQLLAELTELRRRLAELEGSEQARERAERALGLTNERLTLALGSSQIGLWDFDISSSRIYYDQYAHAMLGHAPTDASLDVVTWMSFIHPDDLERVTGTISDHLEGRTDFYDVEFRMRAASGEWRWISSRGKVVERDGAGEPLRMVGTRMDITGRREAEARIEELNEQLSRHVRELEATNKELETFAYTFSHDMKTPLVGIEGISRLLRDKYSACLDETGQHYLAVIHRTACHLQEVVGDLLRFFRLGRKGVEHAPVGVAALVQEVFRELQALSEGRSIRLDLLEVPDARSDRVMLREIFFNLMDNSIKYSRSRPVAVIEVGGRVEEKATLYYVRDNGIGFPMEQADRIFEIFERLHPSDEFEGTGIGLAIVQRLVQRLGGRVWAEGRPGEGAVFHFSIARQEAGI